MGLAEARAAALEIQSMRHRGLNPAGRGLQAQVPTFEQAAQKYIELNRAEWKPETPEKWEKMLSRYAYRTIGSRKVSEVHLQDIKRLLSPIWVDKNPTAKTLRIRLSAIFRYAIAEEWIEKDPAHEDRIMMVMPRVNGHSKNQRAVHYSEVPEAMEKIGNSRIRETAKMLLRFIILTACRSAEATGARWSEVNLTQKTWTIPASRMKTKREHVVVLSDQAVSILRRAAKLTGRSGLVFRSGRETEIHGSTLVYSLKTANVASSVHGFRSSFRTWVSEQTDYDQTLAEFALSHAPDKSLVRRYNRTTQLEKRRPMMEDWAEYVTGKMDGV